MREAVEHPEPPRGPRPRRPPRRGLWGEWKIGVELARLLRDAPRLRRQPRGDGSVVVLIPGWKSPELTMSPLRAYLRWLGYDARHWGLGINRGDPEGDSERMLEIVSRLAAGSSRPVALVGWSLGGVVARETARLAPDRVSQVITYGTPVIGGPTYTLAAGAWGRDECERIAAKTAEADRDSPICVPITAIFSRQDAVVSWSASIDRTSPYVRHYEVASTHIAMGVDPAVWALVAQRLADSSLAQNSA